MCRIRLDNLNNKNISILLLVVDSDAFAASIQAKEIGKLSDGKPWRVRQYRRRCNTATLTANLLALAFAQTPVCQVLLALLHQENPVLDGVVNHQTAYVNLSGLSKTMNSVGTVSKKNHIEHHPPIKSLRFDGLRPAQVERDDVVGPNKIETNTLESQRREMELEAD